jgi:hypothetical protein
LYLTNQGPLILIGMFQTPHSIAETGAVEHERRMCERGSETRKNSLPSPSQPPEPKPSGYPARPPPPGSSPSWHAPP